MKKEYIKPEIETVSVEAAPFMQASGNVFKWNPNGGNTSFKVYDNDDDIDNDDEIG